MPASVLILTLNEERNLPDCLETVSWSDDVVVLDSYSTDRTVAIARAAGARVVQRKFDNWSAHQNWSVRNIQYKYPWVYYSDADERVRPELAREIQGVTADATREEVAYRVRFRSFFMGRWVKRASLYPTWVLRLFRPDKVRWERLVNPTAVVDGPVGRLRCHFDHYSFSKGLSEWFAKHNAYSDDEAREIITSVHKSVGLSHLFSSDPARRRASLKLLAYRLPGRPVLLFLYLYLFRMGFLEGSAGLSYCTLRAVYEYMIDIKATELRRLEQGLLVKETRNSTCG